jgi:hypothetical protein
MWLERALASAEKDLDPEHPSLPVIFERAAVTRFSSEGIQFRQAAV